VRALPGGGSRDAVNSYGCQNQSEQAECAGEVTAHQFLQASQAVDFAVATDVQVYFCDPQSPWQRGWNENANGLLRQYFPRGTDQSGYTQANPDQVALRFNQRPRKTLGFQTPASRLQESVASTELT
jgi:IS30 family transposase